MKKIISIVLAIVSILSIFSVNVFAVTDWEIANGEADEDEIFPETGATEGQEVFWSVRANVTDSMDYCCITFKITIVDMTNMTSFVKEVKWNNKNLDKKMYVLVDSTEYPGHERDYMPVKIVMYADEYYKADRDLIMDLYILENQSSIKELDVISRSSSNCDFDAYVKEDLTTLHVHWDTDMFAQNRFYLEAGTNCGARGYHWWSHFYTTQNYTCTLPQLGRRVCLHCGATETDVETAPAQHNHRFLERVATTCTTDGYEKWKCTECGHILTKTYNAWGHVWISDEIYYTPTCQFTPGRWRKCFTCEQYFKDETYHLDNENQSTVPCVLEYSIFRKYTAATCTENAKLTDRCKWCGRTMVEEYEGTAGHKNFAKRWKDGIAPTCTTGAVLEEYCTDCGYIKTSTEVGAHNYGEWTVKSTATCYANEIQQRTCPDCGNVEEKEIEGTKVSHKYDIIRYKKPTCTEDGYYELHCTYCNKLYSENTIRKKTGHTFTIVSKTEPTCENAGVTIRKCSTCGTVEEDVVEALGHDYVETKIPATTTTPGYVIKTCVRCRVSNVEVIPIIIEETTIEETTVEETTTVIDETTTTADETTTVADETTTVEETTETPATKTNKCFIFELIKKIVALFKSIINK